MSVTGYDEGFDPPAPVLVLRVRGGGRTDWVQLPALVDTGADVTLLPADVCQREFPVAGQLRLRGVTGEVEPAAVYRVDVDVGGLRAPMLVAGFGDSGIAGRDLLNRLVLTLDGPQQTLRVEVPESGDS